MDINHDLESPAYSTPPAPMPDPKRSGLAGRADRIANFFNVLAILAAIFGSIATVVVLFGTAADGDAGAALIAALVVAIYTVMAWAWLNLTSVIAGYISVRLEEDPRAFVR